ncbi:MAG TPA: aminotransferase class V-fold PLP-dependent enzyme, partial [Pyrinomonadaceae bacterium]|nr:aminotransferase class V-fold PLP-dependent enzyme [Pyrinomonadaceae bacterium]
APRLQQSLEPKVTGWMAHASPFSFEDAPIRYAEGIARFLHGSPAIPALYAAESGYRVINEIGVERIRRKSTRQTERLIALADEAGLKVTSPRDPARRGGTITLAVEHAAAVTSELIRREFIVDYRPGAGIRVSPHFYTKDEELDAVIRETRTIIDTRAYAQHETAGAAF